MIRQVYIDDPDTSGCVSFLLAIIFCWLNAVFFRAVFDDRFGYGVLRIKHNPAVATYNYALTTVKKLPSLLVKNA
jgi:hypothetical protein